MNKTEKSILKFMKGFGKTNGRKSNERYASFDYCYNYFYTFYKKGKIKELSNDKNLEMSCLQLGFYLASWGMMRGSSFILQKSVKNYSMLIKAISEMDSKLWEIDVDKYDDEKNVKLLLDCKEKIIKSLGEENNPTDTLVTKIMLGVFANVPAFDQFFRKRMHVGRLNNKSLKKINEFYHDKKYKKTIDKTKIYTLRFNSGKNPRYRYTKAKIIDMIGFIEGQIKKT